MHNVKRDRRRGAAAAGAHARVSCDLRFSNDARVFFQLSEAEPVLDWRHDTTHDATTALARLDIAHINDHNSDSINHFIRSCSKIENSDAVSSCRLCDCCRRTHCVMRILSSPS